MKWSLLRRVFEQISDYNSRVFDKTTRRINVSYQSANCSHFEDQFMGRDAGFVERAQEFPICKNCFIGLEFSIQKTVAAEMD
jgi:hypothetical protein